MNTPSTSSKIVELRELLAQKFPTAPARPEAVFPTGIEVLDSSLGGGLCKGGLVELVAESPSSGSASLLRALFTYAAGQGLWTGLIDGRDTFDPASCPTEALARLLWIRCHSAAEAMQSTDLLLRDGNLPLVCLDLRANPATELRKVTGPNWYRLQRVLEPTSIAFLAVTPYPLVPCADVRLQLQAHFSLAELEDEPASLWRHVEMQVTRKRIGTRDAGEERRFRASA